MRGFLETILGQLGGRLFDFYEANSLWIHLLVLAYGAWVVLSWINLKGIHRSLIQSLVEQMNGRPEFEKTSVQPAALAGLTVPYETAMRGVRFPFVAMQMDLLPRRLSVDTVRKMLPSEHLAREALGQYRLSRQRSVKSEQLKH